MGKRNKDDSKRKGEATADGLRGRRERGDPVGALPDGYNAEAAIVDGLVVMRRVIDEARMAAVALRAMDLAEAGHTPGDVARALNAACLTTRRGKEWTTRAARRLILNAAYSGANGYPAVIDRERWERIVGGLKRLDPVATQARKGGGRAAEERLLRRVGTCHRCGATMYYRTLVAGPHLICGAVREARGTCDLPSIPAAPVEGYVLNHLWRFHVDVRQWLEDRAQEGRAERDALERDAARFRAEVAKVDRRIERTAAQHEGATDADDRESAAAALVLLARYDAQRSAAEGRQRDAEARAAEWAAEPSLDAALDEYNAVADLIAGRLDRASGAAELNAALRDLLEEMNFDVVDGRVVVGFRLRPMAGRTNEFTLMSPSEPPERLGRTGHETFVSRPKQPVLASDRPAAVRATGSGQARRRPTDRRYLGLNRGLRET
jgi:hypothetical protein